ncbi:sugar-binding protein [Burkholderia lata]|uniref:RHS repeat-associated core domain-containing protein n=1 Tax=Burkholderia lata (strain ATCC 17760 / DSM 23089 / LMG 22485 / NCIMB 9086 / R18194 / 383) TaxID=482957 RepID=UPI001452B20E|nr:sugar-binding protein [Burkholderia lata]
MLDGKELVQIERDDLHRETLRTLPSKIDQHTAYDRAGRLAQRTVQRANAPAPLAERRYRYDAAGQLVQIEDNRRGLTDYRYDPVGRLLESIGPAGKERFAFDPASNIIDPARVEPPRTESRPSPVRAMESTLPAEVPKVLGNLLKQYAGEHFAYDARGNLVHRRSPAGGQRYEWNAFNRMTAATVDEIARRSESRYYYDALGRRIAKEVNGERTVFGWDGDTLAYESGGQGSTHYLYEAGSFVPMVQYTSASVDGFETPSRRETDRYVPEDDPLQRLPERVGDAHAFYYHCDQIGTPQLLTDDAGDVVWEASYKAWGEAREIIARASTAAGITLKNPLRFQGQQVDEETGLHYNRHRYYDPTSGRLISKDPIGLAGGVNVYQYAPNPIGWIDPLGLKKCRPCPEDCEKILAESGRKYGPYNNVPADSHHVIQNAAMKGVSGYDDNAEKTAPSVQLAGPSHEIGSEHYIATQSQRQRGVGGTYAAERRVVYRALRRAGLSTDETRCHVM